MLASVHAESAFKKVAPMKFDSLQAKRRLRDFGKSLYDYDGAGAHSAIRDLFAANALIQLAFPFETIGGPDALFETAYRPLAAAIPDLERRDLIVIAGTATNGGFWAGCCGHYMGTFSAPWLDIPPTGQLAAMRYHEFFRWEEGKVVELQALWDIPEIMMQARCWPMPPSLGQEGMAPGPATQDGLRRAIPDETTTAASLKLVGDMCAGLGRFAEGGVKAMELDKFWHPAMNWYGPAGIGSSRGISGFRKFHQIPFLKGMPDREGDPLKGHFFADGDYVGFTGWPGMQATISGDGWMGIAPSNQRITMRSLDFWRCDNGLIRENWVLVDLLSVYDQIGIDVFARMREYCRPN